jgi:hypothetical protein
MPSPMKNASKVNNSSHTSTPDCDSVISCEKRFDFSAFNNYFSSVIHPDELIESLQEIRLYYLELSFYVLMDINDMKPLKMLPHNNVQRQLEHLEGLINLIKQLQA